MRYLTIGLNQNNNQNNPDDYWDNCDEAEEYDSNHYWDAVEDGWTEEDDYEYNEEEDDDHYTFGA